MVKFLNPPLFKNVKIPVDCPHNEKCLDNIFLKTKIVFRLFCTSSCRIKKKSKLPEKAFLVIDNIPSHESRKRTTNLRRSFTLFLTSNCTPLRQPMNQYIIKLTIKSYQKIVYPK